ncbi:MAG: TMEM175 family protein [Dokdonella sp.]
MSDNSLPRGRDGFRLRDQAPNRIEAFVDAAFAFAVTLLVISVDAIPESRTQLVDALKGIPAFAVCFMMVAWFWYGHASHTRRYGLDDLPSILLSLVLVFLVLVFVYPLKAMYASFFEFVSGGWLGSAFTIESASDVRFVFIVFGVALGSMGAILALLTERAWQRRDALGLDPQERVSTRLYALSWWCVPVVSVVSIVMTVWIAPVAGQPWTQGIPGMAYALLGAQAPLIAWYQRRLHARSVAHNTPQAED